MIFETINDIKKAEEEMEKLTAEALEEGKISVQKAEEEAEKIRKEALVRVKEEREKICAVAKEDGEKQANRILSAGKQNIQKITSVDTQEAVRYIQEKVLSSYGNL